MVEIATDLLGKTVEVSRYPEYNSNSLQLQARGVVRAVFWHDKLGLSVLVEHEKHAGLSWAAEHTGALRSYPIGEHVVREVVQCARCYCWKHPTEMKDGFVDDVADDRGQHVCKEHGTP